MSHIFGHAGSGSPLHFDGASADDVPGMRMEPKYCELCGRQFIRVVGTARRDCAKCTERAAAVITERSIVPSSEPRPQALRVN